MNGVNKAIILGRVGKDPEIRYTANGDAVANLSVATSERWKDKNTGEQQESTEWHRCVAFKRTAEIIEEYVKKGDPIYIEGKLQTRSWEQDGVKKYSTEIVVKEMQMLGSKSEGQPEKPKQSQQQDSGFDNFEDSEIPF